MLTAAQHQRADAAFKRRKKEERATEAEEAWAEYLARAAAVEANTARLRSLRLARDAVSKNGSLKRDIPTNGPKRLIEPTLSLAECLAESTVSQGKTGRAPARKK